ncbi:MAG: hypothetical protein M1421_01870 [Candidatus Eremiobacteraeota bacterium]|nr:hypothetical protein [Candidatus Eremiobacteraeota bacterium]MCL5055485.1 hypothetical protein [Bacillota bacterium]
MIQKIEEYYPLRKQEVSWEESDGQIVLLYLFKGEFFTLSPNVGVVWKFSDGKRSILEIISKMGEILEGEQNIVKEVFSSLDYLAENDLIELFPLPLE